MKRVIGWQDLGGVSPRQFAFRGRDHGASVSMFVTDFSPGKGPRLHRHPYEEVFIVHEGLATFTVGDETLQATVGQVLVVPSGTPHRFINAGAGRLLVTSIHPSPTFDQEDLPS